MSARERAELERAVNVRTQLEHELICALGAFVEAYMETVRLRDRESARDAMNADLAAGFQKFTDTFVKEFGEPPA